MEFVFFALKVIFGAFVLFTISRVGFSLLLPRRGWASVALVTVLSLGNMLIHNFFGSTINPPFYTAVFFATTLVGLPSDNPLGEGKVSDDSKWVRRGVWGVAVGSLLGWLSFASVHSL